MKSQAKSFNLLSVNVLAFVVTISRVVPNWNKKPISGPAIFSVRLSFFSSFWLLTEGKYEGRVLCIGYRGWIYAFVVAYPFVFKISSFSNWKGKEKVWLCIHDQSRKNRKRRFLGLIRGAKRGRLYHENNKCWLLKRTWQVLMVFNFRSVFIDSTKHTTLNVKDFYKLLKILKPRSWHKLYDSRPQ